MDEFSFIAGCLSPLAGEGALGLKDDAALLSVPAGQEIVATTDALVAGVHFIGNESPADIARKALRVNLSDLAAMGATPYAYMLALMLPAEANDDWLRAFAEGLKADQYAFGMSLLGGDTTRTPGPLALSVTMLGRVPAGSALRRNGAKEGNDIYVSGTIGDAALGLQFAKESRPSFLAPEHYLLTRYRLPNPRIALGEKLRGIATACMDISDGLVQDMEHICNASGVGAEIHASLIPLSGAAKELQASMETVLSGGDDYELLFTAPATAAAGLQSLEGYIGVTRIGRITGGSGVRVLDDNGAAITLARRGYKHF